MIEAYSCMIRLGLILISFYYLGPIWGVLGTIILFSMD
jgi:hypothetical protein